MAIQSLGQTGSYSTNSHWTPGGLVPVSGDEVVIPETLRANVNGTLDQGSVNLDMLRVHSGYDFSVGSTGGSLITSTKELNFQGSKALYYTCSKNGGSNFTTPLTIIEAAVSGAIAVLDSESGDAGEFTRIICKRGQVTLGSNMVFGASHVLQVGFIDNIASDCHVTIAPNADNVINVIQTGGVIDCSAPIVTAHVANGTLNMLDKAMGIVHVQQGGIFTTRFGGSGVTSATSVNVYNGGTFDVSQAYAEMTFPEVYLFPGSKVIGDYDVLAAPTSKAFVHFTPAGFHDLRGGKVAA